jgi:Spy/CpxP family protein refolding chaperone
MKRLMQITLAAAVVAVAVSPALAQQRGRGFGGGLTFLLSQKSVQEELKLSEEQNKQIKEFADKQRENRPDFQGLDREEIQKKMAERAKAERDALAKILKPEQLKRARQISLQQQVQRSLGFALNNQELAKALKISDEQKDKIQEINRSAFEEMQGLGRDEEGAKKRQEIMKATNTKVEGVLTAEQKAKLKEMQGEPFKGEIQRPQFGRGR